MSPESGARERLRAWNPLAPEELADPYPTYALARRDAPVFYNDYLDAWCVTRYSDVLATVGSTQALSSRQAIGSGHVPSSIRPLMPHGYPWDHPALVNNDPPRHLRIRRLANEAFKPGVIAARTEEIRGIADSLIDGFSDRGRVEFVSEFAEKLPQLVICRLLGVPDEDAEKLARWSEGKIEMVNPRINEARLEQLARGQADFYNFCEAFIEAERCAPRGNSLLSRLMYAHSGEGTDVPALTARELISIISQLLLGGNSTTRRMLSTMIFRLLEDPERWATLQREPGLVGNAVEESLRYNSSVKGLYRDAVEDVEIGSTVIPRGSRVVVLWAAANHDGDVFERPEEFDIRRADAGRHLAFSRLSHFCLGASLARLELRVALEQLLDRLSSIRLSAGLPDWEPLALHAGLCRLDLEFDPATPQERP